MKLGQLLQLRPPRPLPEAALADLSDEALAAACATGDRAAQGFLFERHADAIYRFIARMRASDADAVDDLVQATFLAAFRSAHRFQGARLQSWLYGIAANVMRTYVRKEVARKRIAVSLAEQPPAEDIAPGDADLARVRAAVAALSPKLREAIVLVDLQGESGAEAAEALGIPEGTLWRRLSDARAKLREALGGDP
jgi:RNA polymerase sigma-70 factor (ECF subfamily)